MACQGGLTISELERIYQIDSPGAHPEVKSGAGFENIWPDRGGKFTVPPNCFSTIVMAMHRQENQQENTCMPDYSGGTGSMGNRRGNSGATFFSPAFFNKRFEPSTSTSSFHVMSRGRSKFFPQSGMGSRPVPAVWGVKGKKRKSVESKSFRLTFFDGDGIFEDMWEIPIDLSQIQELLRVLNFKLAL